MSDQWQCYLKAVDQQLTSILVDMGVAPTAPNLEKPWCWRVSIPFLLPTEEGFYCQEEGGTISQIEDAVVTSVLNAIDAVHVGCITRLGARTLIFYSSAKDGVDDAVNSAMSSFEEYRSEVQSEKDPKWQYYFNQLYPSPHDWQRIQNQWVIAQLQQQGDPLSVPRPVSHWAYFPESMAGNRFAQAVQELGYSITDVGPSEVTEKSLSYGVQFQRDDQVDWGSINQVTIELFDLAALHEGEYDGWETSIVAPT